MQYGCVNLKRKEAWKMWLSEEYVLVTITHIEITSDLHHVSMMVVEMMPF